MKLVAQNSSRHWLGNEKALGTLVRGLAERGHEVVVSCAAGVARDHFESLGVRTSSIRPRGVLDVVSALRFAKWLDLERPDAVLLTSWVASLPGSRAARLAGVKRVVLRQGIVRPFPRSRARRLALRRWIDAVVVNAPEIRDLWLANGPLHLVGRINVVLNGIESRLHERDELRRRLRNELGLAPGTLLVGGAGHLAPRKGFDILLRGFATANLPDTRLAILGGGEYGESLKALAGELAIADRVEWLGRRAKGADIIAGYDVFVLSSRNEGMANVMLEAMAAAIPVVASDISGVRTALGPADDRGVAGWITKPDDSQALANALSEIVTSLRGDGRKVRARATEAHWRILNWFSPERMVDQYEEILFGKMSRASER